MNLKTKKSDLIYKDTATCSHWLEGMGWVGISLYNVNNVSKKILSFLLFWYLIEQALVGWTFVNILKIYLFLDHNWHTRYNLWERVGVGVGVDIVNIASQNNSLSLSFSSLYRWTWHCKHRSQEIYLFNDKQPENPPRGRVYLLPQFRSLSSKENFSTFVKRSSGLYSRPAESHKGQSIQ